MNTHEMLAVFGEQSLGFVVCDARMNDDILALLPVDRGGYAMFVVNLERCGERVTINAAERQSSMFSYNQ